MKRGTLAVLCLTLGVLVGSVLMDARSRSQGQAPRVAIPKEITSYRDVVKQVLPAVVSIESRSKAAPQLRRAPLADEGTQLGFGSGFVIDPKGVILTNHHVVEGADLVEITFMDGRKFTSRDIKSDQKTDLAIIRIEAKAALPFLEMGDSDHMEIGDRVLAVGAPFGLTGSVTHGIISGKGRSLKVNMYEDFLQTDAAINPGNSGGPLVDLEGKVIGINSAIKSRSGGFQGVGLAIASNLARNVMTQLQKDGVVHRGYLGVQIKDIVDRELANRLGVEKIGGVQVTVVFDDGPAAKAGLQDGDVIIALGGKPIRDGRELQLIVAGLPLGKPAEITVVRDGKKRTMQVTIEEQPPKFGSARVPVPRSPKPDKNLIGLEKLGAEATDLTPELAEQLGFKAAARGAVLVEVWDRGPAVEAGLGRGMLISKVDGSPVTSAAELRGVLEKKSLADGVLLQVSSPQGGTNYVLLKK